jgi:hypothetical protein
LPDPALNLNTAPLLQPLPSSFGSNPCSAALVFFFHLHLPSGVTTLGPPTYPQIPLSTLAPNTSKIDFHFICDKVASKTLAVRFISNKDNLADIFTKPTASPYFSLMRTKLNIVFPTSRLWGHNEPSRENNQQGNHTNTQRLATTQGNQINPQQATSQEGNSINTNG